MHTFLGRTTLVVVLLVAVAGVARAQPGAQPPGTQPPVAYAQPAPIQLTAEEAELLQQGEISDGTHMLGGGASIFLGLGIGQAIQGRWGDTGWIFTLGESAATVVIIAGAVSIINECGHAEDSCENGDENRGLGLIAVGVVGLAVFRVWEVIDAFTGPPRHNQEVRALRMRLGYSQPYAAAQLAPYLAPVRGGDGAVAGLSLRF